MSDHGTLSREEIAKIEIGHTDSTPAKNWFLTLFFLAVIFSVPVLQNAREFAAIRSGAETGRRLPQSWDVFSVLLPSLAEWRTFFGAGDPAGMFAAARQTNNRMLRDIQAYETALKDRDGIVEAMIPVMQTVVSGWLKGGNEDASCGRDGWLFYRRDLESLTGPGFLEPAVLRQRGAGGSELVAPPQPDPVKAIVDFRDQLAKRGIALVVFPAPVKPSICPEDCTSRYAGGDRESVGRKVSGTAGGGGHPGLRPGRRARRGEGRRSGLSADRHALDAAGHGTRSPRARSGGPGRRAAVAGGDRPVQDARRPRGKPRRRGDHARSACRADVLSKGVRRPAAGALPGPLLEA